MSTVDITKHMPAWLVIGLVNIDNIIAIDGLNSWTDHEEFLESVNGLMHA